MRSLSREGHFLICRTSRTPTSRDRIQEDAGLGADLGAIVRGTVSEDCVTSRQGAFAVPEALAVQTKGLAQRGESRTAAPRHQKVLGEPEQVWT